MKGARGIYSLFWEVFAHRKTGLKGKYCGTKIGPTQLVSVNSLTQRVRHERMPNDRHSFKVDS